MAERIMMATANRARRKIPTGYRLTADEMQELTSMVSNGDDGVIDALLVAFRYGFVLGTRAANRDKVAKM